MTPVSLADLPPLPDTTADRAAIAEFIRQGAPKWVVLDDDPTGTQTVHGVDVLTEWTVASLVEALADPRPCFYLLTNSRSLSLEQAVALNREIVRNLNEASLRSGRAFTLASRSDSTLRGHFPGEVDALADAMPRVDGVLLIPAFFEGRRYTIGDVHYVGEGDRLVPVAETEFARDTTFGFSHSHLGEWVEEKTGGRIRSSAVRSIGIDSLRRGGAGAVEQALRAFPRGATIVVNAADYGDLEIFTHGLLRLEREGRRYIARTAAGFVRVRAGISAREALAAGEIAGAGRGRGLVVVGSYISKSTRQLEAALLVAGVAGLEVRVDRLAADADRLAEVARVVREADAVLHRGGTAIVYTSRSLTSALGRAGDLDAGRTVSAALVGIVRGLAERPRFLIAKGGITSSDLAVKGLGVRKAEIIGQAAPGIPVWKLGAESRFPGMSYVVFPGNVGGPDSLRELIEKLSP